MLGRTTNRKMEAAIRAAGERLVCQAGAFLSGELALEATLRGEAPPEWQWLNVLAHRTVEQLTDLADGGPPVATRSSDEEKWNATLRFLAAHVLGLTDSRVSLAELQRSVLVPLELELAASKRDTPLTPRAAACTVVSRLAHLRRG